MKFIVKIKKKILLVKLEIKFNKYFKAQIKNELTYMLSKITFET